MIYIERCTIISDDIYYSYISNALVHRWVFLPDGSSTPAAQLYNTYEQFRNQVGILPPLKAKVILSLELVWMFV